MRHPARHRLGAVAKLVFALASLLLATIGRAQDLQVIELRHRLADEIIPIVTPLLEPGGALTGADRQLLVRTSPANFAQIQAAVAAIDRELRQLRITVGQGTISSEDTAEVRGSATIGDDDVRVGVNRPPGSSSGAEVQARMRSLDSNLHDISTVQTLEGSETFIFVGRSVPIRSTEVLPGRHGPVVQRSTTFEDVASGFCGTARLNGDTVVLEISPRQQRYATERNGVVESRGMTSTVTGRLGEWMELGAVSQTDSDASTGILVWGRRTGQSEYAAWVRVEAVP
jgi:hypothetical protein